MQLREKSNAYLNIASYNQDKDKHFLTVLVLNEDIYWCNSKFTLAEVTGLVIVTDSGLWELNTWVHLNPAKHPMNFTSTAHLVGFELKAHLSVQHHPGIGSQVITSMRIQTKRGGKTHPSPHKVKMLTKPKGYNLTQYFLILQLL